MPSWPDISIPNIQEERLEQFAADYEEAYSELEGIGEHHTDSARRRKILANLYDPSQPDTKILVSYCERNCSTFAEVIDHLTSTHIRDAHYNNMHSMRKAKASKSTMVRSDDEDSGSDEELAGLLRNPNIWAALQSIQGKSTLPAEYKIPRKAWDLMSPTAREEFTTARNQILDGGESGGGGGGGKIPKQYGGQDMTRPGRLTSPPRLMNRNRKHHWTLKTQTRRHRRHSARS